jgi:hypothetical protein
VKDETWQEEGKKKDLEKRTKDKMRSSEDGRRE